MKNAWRDSVCLKNTTDMEMGWSLTQAFNEASRCHLCHDAPCSKACPAGTDPAGFIRKLRLKNVRGAIRTIKENNILGGICAVVCPTEKLCQKACVAQGLDRAIDIGKIQRFLVEHGWSMNFKPVEKSPTRQGKVAIIGSGPAGLACAAEVSKHGHEVEIFEGMEKPGGVLRYGVPSFRLHPDFLDRELKDLEELGVKIRCHSRIGENGIEKLLSQGYSAVFFAPGAWKPVEIDIPGMQLENVFSARDFLGGVRIGNEKEFRSRISGKNVAVYGGGSVAMDAATTAAAMGARKVYIIYRRSFNEMPAARQDVEMALANNINFRVMSVVTELTGDSGNVLTGLKGKETDWKIPGNTSSANLVVVPDTEFNLKVDLFIAALGFEAERETSGICADIQFNQKGFVVTGEDGVSTRHPAVFAGGDIVRGPAMVVDAVADGKAAGRKIVSMLKEKFEGRN